MLFSQVCLPFLVWILHAQLSFQDNKLNSKSRKAKVSIQRKAKHAQISLQQGVVPKLWMPETASNLRVRLIGGQLMKEMEIVLYADVVRRDCWTNFPYSCSWHAWLGKSFSSPPMMLPPTELWFHPLQIFLSNRKIPPLEEDDWWIAKAAICLPQRPFDVRHCFPSRHWSWKIWSSNYCSDFTSILCRPRDMKHGIKHSCPIIDWPRCFLSSLWSETD